MGVDVLRKSQKDTAFDISVFMDRFTEILSCS